MRIPVLDKKTFTEELERQWLEDSRGALSLGYAPTGHVVPHSSEQHLREYVSLRRAYTDLRRTYTDLVHRGGLSKAAVLDYESALALLTHLYSRGAIQVPDLYGLGLSESDVPIAVGTLSEAHLCSVDRHAVRITAEGMSYVDDILKNSPDKIITRSPTV